MQRILVTAASSDLAKALVRIAAQQQRSQVLTVSRSTFVVPASQYAAHHHMNGIDLLQEDALSDLACTAASFFDGPFSIIHFAGDYWTHKPLIHTELSEIRRMMESHYLTLCGVAKYLAPVMIEKGGGRLVAFSCNSVVYNDPDLSPFTSAKAAIESFVRSFANEYAEVGLSATAIALPTMRTEKVLAEKTRGDHENYISPDELARILLEQTLKQDLYITGNITRLVKYSDSFYHKSYFLRNPREKTIP